MVSRVELILICKVDDREFLFCIKEGYNYKAQIKIVLLVETLLVGA